MRSRLLTGLFHLLLLTGGACLPLFGQGLFRFHGPLSLGSLQGDVTYRYDLQEEDTVLNGPFSLRSHDPEALFAGKERYCAIEGTFLNDAPDSTWRVLLGDFQVSEKIAFEDHRLQVPVSGVEHVATVRFEAGMPTGEWSQQVSNIEASNVTAQPFESQVSIEGGAPQGTLRLIDEAAVMLGRFLPGGLAHDVWELDRQTTPGQVERWHFVEGRLTAVVLQTEQTTDSLTVYGQALSSAKVIPLDGRYFRILSLQKVWDTALYASKGGLMLHLLMQHATYDRAVRQALSEVFTLGQPVPWPEFGVKVAHYPLSNAEQKNLKEIRSHLTNLEQTYQSLRENTRLNLLKRSDEEVSFLLAAAKAINQELALPAREVMAYRRDQLLAYFPRERLPALLGLGPELPTQIAVNWSDSDDQPTRSFPLIRPDTTQQARPPLATVAQLAKQGWRAMDSIQQELREHLQDQKLEKEYQGLEITMLARAEPLEQHLDSLQRVMAEAYQPALQALKGAIDADLRHYAAIEDWAEKPDQAQAVIDCMARLQELTEVIAQLPSRRDTIERLYTEQVWNPFTATTMEDPVKERITSAYLELLVPFLLNELDPKSACEQADQYRATLDALYTRLKQLRKQNTSKLERKLKNEADPQVVMRLLEVPKQP